MSKDATPQYLIYLRKSQKDREVESATGVADTLQRHRDRLLALARERNYSIAHIYEEVLSGDTIAERPEMRKLLLAAESGLYAGVLVMEISRLARGNTRDQGVVAETFLYTGTKIITPDRIYDTAEDADEEYLEFELFMARREYKAINRRQQRGKMASLHEGKYIGGVAPYGYEKIKLSKQKGWTLKIVPEKADIVQEIFDLYTVGVLQEDGSRRKYGAYSIAEILNRRGTAAPSGKPWSSSAVKELLTNPTYAGYIRWGYRAPEKRMRDGVVVETRPLNKEAVLIEGLHDEIISRETWEVACRIRASRSHTPIPARTQLSNPLAGLLVCSECGRSMVGLPQRKANRHNSLMIKCPSANCKTVSSTLKDVEEALMNALRQWLENYKTETESTETPQSTSGIDTITRELSRLTSDLATAKTQQSTLYDLLEQGVYDKDTFLERSRALAARLTEINRTISEGEKRLFGEQIAQESREQLIPSIERVLIEYETLESAASKNIILKEALAQVIYSKSVGGRWIEGDLQLYVFPKLRAPTHDL